MCCKRRGAIKEFPYYGKKSISKYEQRKCIDCKEREWEKANKNIDFEKFLQSVCSNTNRRNKDKFQKESKVTKEFLKELYQRQEGKCAISGIELTYIRRTRKKILTNISLDRLDSSKPYSKDNVQLVCVGINLMKNNVDNEVFLKFFKEIIKASN